MALLEAKSPSKRQKLEILRSELEQERSSFLPHWRQLGDNFLPRRPRFVVTDVNRGDRRNTNIIDSTGSLAVRTLRAGMMGGVTSPARPWFSLKVPDPDLNEYSPVKEWCHVVTKRMGTVFLNSNLYNSLPIVYGDLGVFGTAAMGVEQDREDVIRTQVFPIGSYSIAVNARGRVNVFFRDFMMTVRQVVSTFGRKDEETGKPDWSNISSHVKHLWDNAQYETKIQVCHVVMPNEDYDRRQLRSKYKRYLSCYYELGAILGAHTSYLGTIDQDRYLRESGFDYFPVLAPRWDVTGEDAWGTSCPGMESLGDQKQLHQGERRIAEAVDKMIRPPMKGPSALQSRPMSILPGGFTADDSRDGKGFGPSFQIEPRVQELEFKQDQIRKRIQRAFFEDLFLMMAYSDRRQITAREIEERHEEKLLALGPVLEQLNQDLLNPLIDNTFYIMLERGLIPKPPDEIAGMDLKVEYTSVMAQAQKLVGVGGIERYAAFITNLAQVDESIKHKANLNQMADEYADALGVSPKINRTEEEVGQILNSIAKAQQQTQMLENMKQAADTAKSLSQSQTTGDNALTELMGDAISAGEYAAVGG